MSKESLVNRVVESTGLTKKDVETAWKAFQSAIQAELKEDQEVTIAGVGKLKPAVRSARTGRNPQTGDTIDIPERATVKLAVSKAYAEN